jgi:hypothetical protein
LNNLFVKIRVAFQANGAELDLVYIVIQVLLIVVESFKNCALNFVDLGPKKVIHFGEVLMVLEGDNAHQGL